MSGQIEQVDRLRWLAETTDTPERFLGEYSQALREAADTIESLRDRLQAVDDETCSIEWRDESSDSDAGLEDDGAYFCTKCGADLPYSLQEDWDDYQALVADYGNVEPWNKKPFLHCPNCGAKIADDGAQNGGDGR